MEYTRTNFRTTTTGRKRMPHLLPAGLTGDEDDTPKLLGDVDRDEERARGGNPPTCRPSLAPQTVGPGKAGGNTKISQWQKLLGAEPLVVMENNFQTSTRQQQLKISFDGEIFNGAHVDYLSDNDHCRR